MKRSKNKVLNRIAQRRNKEEEKRTKLGLWIVASFAAFVFLSIQLHVY